MHNNDILAIAGLRVDGRRKDEIRLISLKLNSYFNVDGSCYLEHGLNKVLVLVHGPQEPIRRNDSQSEEGLISCKFITSSFSSADRRKRRNNDRKTQETEKIITDVFTEIVKLDLYSRSEISIVIHLLESDGSSISSIINATSLALMDAGIAMTDIVVSCCVGILKDQICLDLNQIEQSSSQVFMPVVIAARSEEILYIQMDSKITNDNLNDCMQLSLIGCKKILNIMEDSVKESMIYMIEQKEKSENT